MNDIEDVKTQALFNEAGICAHLIGTGLTNIRKAHSAPGRAIQDSAFASFLRCASERLTLPLLFPTAKNPTFKIQKIVLQATAV